MGGHSSTTLTRPRVVAVIATAGVSFFLPRTLRGLARQTHPPDAVIIVDVSRPDGEAGTGTPIHELLWETGLERRCPTAVVRAPKAERFGHAVAAAEEKIADFFSDFGSPPSGQSVTSTARTAFSITGAERHADSSRPRDPGWLWLLHDDSAPASQALDLLLQAGENSRNLAIAGPKHNGWVHTDRVREVGIRATRSARRVPDIALAELDQGQYDTRSDVLAVGSAGMLIRWDIYRELGGFDPALGPYGDGLEISRRARLAGYRVEVVPAAVIYHAQASYRGLRRGARARALALATRPSARQSSVDPSADNVIVSPASRSAHYSLEDETGGHITPASSERAARITCGRHALSAPDTSTHALEPARSPEEGLDEGTGAADPARETSGSADTAPAEAYSDSEDNRAQSADPDFLDVSASFAERRRAQMYNAVLATAHLPWLRLLGYLILAPARALVRLVGKAPDLAGAEMQAARGLAVASADIRRARKAHPLLRSAAAQRSLAPLEDSARQVRYFRRLRRDDAKQLSAFDAPTDVEIARARAHAKRQRRGWITLTSITVLVSFISFFSLLTAGQLTGGALLPDHSSVGELWEKFRNPWLASGDGSPGPADPYLLTWAAFSLPASWFSLNAGMAHTLLIVLALPLAGWAAWFASGAFTTSATARLWAALAWACAPAVVMAASEGRAPAVAAHILLAWAIGLAARGRRHPAAAAGASLFFAVTVAAAPILLIVPLIWSAVGVIIRRGQRLRWAWLAIPSLALLAPTIVSTITYPQRLIRFFLASPGLQVDGGEFSAAVLLGIPHGGIALENLPPALTIVLACALLGGGGLALIGSVRASLGAGAMGHRGRGALMCAGAALAGAMVIHLVELGPGESLSGDPIVIRPYAGPLASLALGALIIGAVSAARADQGLDDSRSLRHRLGAPALAGVVGLSLLGPIALLPLISFGVVDKAHLPMWLQAAPAREVPALAHEYQRSEERSRVLALRLAEGEIIGELWRGPGRQLSDYSVVRAVSRTDGFPRPTISHQPISSDPAASEVAAAVAMLTGSSDPSAVLDVVSRHAISLIVLTPDDNDSPSAQTRRIQTANVISAVPGLERVTENESGIIWRVSRSNIAPGPGSLEQTWGRGETDTDSHDDGAGGRQVFGPSALSRVRIVDGDTEYPIPSGISSVSVDLVESKGEREVILAERAAGDWRASFDGQALAPIHDADDWRQRFVLPAHAGHLKVSYSPRWYTPVSWLQFAVVVITVIAALPIRRRGGRNV